MIWHLGLLRRGGSKGEIDLLEPYRATGSHDLALEDGVWRATGIDPYILYDLDQRANEGALQVDLDLEVLDGRINPRIYLHGRNSFTQAGSELMRRTSTSHFRQYVYLTSPCKMLRLDPAEAACAFRLRSFSVRRVPAAVFLSRVLRDGAKKGEERPSFRRLTNAFRLTAKTGVAFEVIDDGETGQLDDRRYIKWIRHYDYSDSERYATAAALMRLPNNPLISVLMPVYNTPKRLLDEAIASVGNQIYSNWELCIADDKSTVAWVKPLLQQWMQRDNRIKVTFREENGHIAEATNSAFTLAAGDYVALLDHVDILRPHALAEVAFALHRQPNAEIVYSDEDKIEEDGGRRFDPFFKPGWNPDLFLSQNYLNHLTVHRSSNIRAVSGWRKDYCGSQDYDLNLRIVRMIDVHNIVHIPKILYHCRIMRESMAHDESAKRNAVDNAIKALQSFIGETGLRGTVSRIAGTSWYRVQYHLPHPPPLVSLVIPTRNGYDILKACIDSIRELTTYPNYELIIIDNGSDDPLVLDYFRKLEQSGAARVLLFPHPFNYSAISNFGIAQAKGELVGMVNNDVTVISPGWLTEMVSLALRPGIGCVGAKLYYPNDTIQHAGVITGLGGVAGNSHKHFDRKSRGYFGRLMVVHNVTAVTAACLIVKKSIYEEVGGLDTVNLKVAFNDVDFCLKVTTAGYTNVWTPFAELYHHESVSRGADDDPVKQERFKSEVLYMKAKWGSALQADPHYSPNLTLAHEDYSINVD